MVPERPISSAAKRRVDGPPITWEQTRAFRLQRMHLVEPLGARSLRKVVKDLAGVQAQLASAGAQQCQIRARGAATEAIDSALHKKKTLVKAWAMRGTLHWIDADDFPAWAAALSIRPRWDSAREKFWKKEFGLSWKEVSTCIDVVMDVLDGQRLTRVELAEAVYKKMRNSAIDERLRSGWGEITKVVALRGGLCFGPSEGRNITFVRADQWVPGWKELDPNESLQKVLLRYLASHGPATREEFSRWWGFTPADARKVIEALESKLATVERDGAAAYVLKKDLKVVQQATEDDSVRLLPMFDAYTLAGLPHEAIVPQKKKSRVYRTGAWVWPVVARGGVIVGAWNVGKKTKRVEVELFKKGSVTKTELAEAFEIFEPLLNHPGPISFV